MINQKLPQETEEGLLRILESHGPNAIRFAVNGREFSAFFAPGPELRNATGVSIFPNEMNVPIAAGVKELMEGYIRANNYTGDINYPAERNPQ